jgi:hypothetical protein
MARSSALDMVVAYPIRGDHPMPYPQLLTVLAVEVDYVREVTVCDVRLRPRRVEPRRAAEAIR